MRLRLPEAFWPSSLDARPLASTAAANGVLAACGLLTGMLAARLLGAEGRGQLAAAQAWPLLLAALGSFGLTEAVAYFAARSPARARTALTTGLVLAAPFSLTAVAAGLWLVPRALQTQTAEVQHIAVISLLLVPVMALSAAPAQALRGVGAYGAWNALRLVTPLAWLVALVAVRGTGHATVSTLAVIFIGAQALAGGAAHLYAWRRLSGPSSPEPSLVRPMLAYGAPTMMTAMPQWLNLRLDQLIMIAFLDARSIGLYVVAAAWSMAVQPLATVIAYSAVPALAGAKDGHRKAHLVYRAGAMVAVGTSVLVLAATPTLLPLIFGAEFRSALPAALVLVVAGALACTNTVGAECLRGIGRPRAVLLAESAGLVVTAVALPVLIPLGGIVGAAVASLLSCVAILVVQRRQMRTPSEDTPLELPAEGSAAAGSGLVIARRPTI